MIGPGRGGPQLRRGAVRLAAGLAWLLGAQPGSAALPSATHAGDLARVEDYLNGLTTLKADFVQINPDGGTVTGELYYQRPDKMRLDYNPPSDILIISDGWHITYYDRRLEQASHVFPINAARVLLSDEIRLSGDVGDPANARRASCTSRWCRPMSPTRARSGCRSPRSPGAAALDRGRCPGWRPRRAAGGPQLGLALDRELFRFRNPKFYPDARN